MAARKRDDIVRNLPPEVISTVVRPEGSDGIEPLRGDPDGQKLLAEVLSYHSRSFKAQGWAVLHGILCGHKVATLKAHVGHGRFSSIQSWLAEHHGVSQRTLQRYMLLARNKEALVQRLREMNPPNVADLPDEQILEGTSISHALRLINHKHVDCNDPSNPPPKDRPTIRQLKWRSCQLPASFGSTLPKVWMQVDAFVSDVDEAVEVPEGCSQPASKAVSLAAALHGYVLINAIRKHPPRELLHAVMASFERGEIVEAFVAVPSGIDPLEITPFRGCSRLMLRTRPQVEITTPKGRETLTYPCPVMVLLLTSPERLPVVAAAFQSVGDLFTPLVAASSR